MFTAWLIGAGVGVVAYFISRPMLEKSKLFRNSRNRKMMLTIFAAVIGLIIMVITSLVIRQFVPESGVMCWFNPARCKTLQCGPQDQVQDAAAVGDLVTAQYAGRLSLGVIDYMKLKLSSTSPNGHNYCFDDISLMADAFASSGNFMIQDQVMNKVSLPRVAPGCFNENEIDQWCDILAKLLWGGYTDVYTYPIKHWDRDRPGYQTWQDVKLSVRAVYLDVNSKKDWAGLCYWPTADPFAQKDPSWQDVLNYLPNAGEFDKPGIEYRDLYEDVWDFDNDPRYTEEVPKSA